MSNINEDLPYDKYIENRERGRKAYSKNKHLTEPMSLILSPILKRSMEGLIAKGIFPDKAEFLRYLMIKFFEENKEWLK